MRDAHTGLLELGWLKRVTDYPTVSTTRQAPFSVSSATASSQPWLDFLKGLAGLILFNGGRWEAQKRDLIRLACTCYFHYSGTSVDACSSNSDKGEPR